MCYRVEVKADIKQIAKRYNADAAELFDHFATGEVNGFAHQAHPLILDKSPKTITTNYHWGLIPAWSKDDSIKKMTLNAKIETLEEKPAFKNAVSQRCLVIATAYFEWHWEDDKGKIKQKYIIHSAEEEIFSLAGIYSTWNNPVTNEKMNTFSIVTTQANETMQYVHNNKKRMPILLKKSDENHWLSTDVPYQEFAFPNYNPPLLAFPAE